MANTFFIDQQTPVVASWLNDINNTVYKLLSVNGSAPASASDIVNALGVLTTSSAQTIYAPLVSPSLTGSPTAPTPLLTDNSTAIATTAFVQGLIAGLQSQINTINSKTYLVTA